MAELCNAPLHIKYLGRAAREQMRSWGGADDHPPEAIVTEDFTLKCERPRGHPGEKHVTYHRGDKYIFQTGQLSG